MKVRGRKQSGNIEDLRNYFGTDALDTDYGLEDQQNDFVAHTLANPMPDAPQKFGLPQIPAGLFADLPPLPRGVTPGTLRNDVIGMPRKRRKVVD